MRICLVKARTARRNFGNVRVRVLQMLPLAKCFNRATTKQRNGAHERLTLDHGRLSVRRAVSNSPRRLRMRRCRVGVNEVLQPPILISERMLRQYRRFHRNKRVISAANTKHQKRRVGMLMEEIMQRMLVYTSPEGFGI
jgi:hypothetical protein